MDDAHRGDGQAEQHGVLAAVALALSFGAVLTFTAASLSATAQEAFGGTLSVIAVAFVTAMVFWMRRSARSLSGEIKERVTGALGMGAGVLVLTSFLAVGREGLETALFLWTTAQAAGESAGPLTGAAVGLVLAAGLCWGLYRRVLKINLTKFFTATGAVLIASSSAGRQAAVRGHPDPSDRRTPRRLHLTHRRRLLLRPARGARHQGLARPRAARNLRAHGPGPPLAVLPVRLGATSS